MCTVIYVPLEHGVLFCSTRDENPGRAAALPPAYYPGASGRILCPLDPQAGGTWIGVHEAGHVCILMNGGFEPHQASATHVVSRGLINRAMLDSRDPLQTWNDLELTAVAPFTLLLYTGNALYRLTWDGVQQHQLLLDHQQAGIWSSATLYDKPAMERRQAWFQEWQQQQGFRTINDLQLFLKHYPDKHNGFLMNRDHKVQTLSISLLSHTPELITYTYQDLLTNSSFVTTLNR